MYVLRAVTLFPNVELSSNTPLKSISDRLYQTKRSEPTLIDLEQLHNNKDSIQMPMPELHLPSVEALEISLSEEEEDSSKALIFSNRCSVLLVVEDRLVLDKPTL